MPGHIGFLTSSPASARAERPADPAVETELKVLVRGAGFEIKDVRQDNAPAAPGPDENP